MSERARRILMYDQTFKPTQKKNLGALFKSKPEHPKNQIFYELDAFSTPDIGRLFFMGCMPLVLEKRVPN